MGLMASGCRLSPTDDSLKTLLPDRLRRSLFYIVNTLPCPRQKVNCFSRTEAFLNNLPKIHRWWTQKIGKLPVDKQQKL
jgi:hypothetical protein